MYKRQLEDLHAEQKEFPHCIADGIFVLQEEDAEPGLNMARILGFCLLYTSAAPFPPVPKGVVSLKIDPTYADDLLNE